MENLNQSEIKPFIMPEHDCFWCGEKTRSMHWACERCGPLKEEGYARAREAGENNYGQVINRVFDVLKENGVGIDLTKTTKQNTIQPMPTPTKLARNPKYRKKSKSVFQKARQTSDLFWKRKLMQVLEVFHDQELHWHKELWSDYGISDADARVIEKVFSVQKAWRARGRNDKVGEVD
jgi:hypothetical protein